MPRERLDGEATPTAELTCGTCSWFVTVDVVSALQFEPRVTSTLLELGLPLGESSSMRATEQVLPDVTGRVSADDSSHATISIAHDDAAAEITVTDELGVQSVSVEYPIGRL